MRIAGRRRWASVLALCASVHTIVFAGGFDSPTISARGAGMGGVMAMLTHDPASASVNPASLTYLRGTQFSIGTTVVLPDFRFTPEADPSRNTKMQAQVLFPPNFCLTHTFDSGLGLGVTVSNPYSIKTDWGNEWPGRRVIAASEMRGFAVTPMVSFHVTRAVAMGLGLNITSFRFVRSARVLSTATEGIADLEGTERMQGTGTPAYGLELGMLVVPDDVFSFGFAYKSRSRVVLDDGLVSTEWPAVTLPASSSTFRTSFTLPDRMHAGMSFRPFEFMVLAGELEFVRWSSIDNLVISAGDPATKQIVEQQDWKDVLTAHAGLEISFGEIALRAGIVIDRSPIRDEQLRPSVPDADRRAYTVGIGYAIGEGLTMDVALQSVKYSSRTVTNSAISSADGGPLNGTYDMNGTNICLNVSYSWK